MRKENRSELTSQQNSEDPFSQTLFVKNQWLGIGFLIVIYLGFGFIFSDYLKDRSLLISSPFYWLPFLFGMFSAVSLRLTALNKISDSVLLIFLLSTAACFIYLDFQSGAAPGFILSAGISLLLLSGYLFLLPKAGYAVTGGLLATTAYFVYLFMNPVKANKIPLVLLSLPVFINIFGILYQINSKRLYELLINRNQRLKKLATESKELQNLQSEFKELKNQSLQQQSSITNLQEKLVDLKNLLQLEQSLTNLAIRFIQAPVDETDEMINKGLRTLCDYFEADRAYLYFFAKKGTILNKSHEYSGEGIKEKIARHEKVNNEDFSWFIKSLKRATHLAISDIEQLPIEASTLKSIWKVEEVKSLFIVPLTLNDAVVGFIGLDYLDKRETWPAFTEHTLLSAGLIFLNTLERKRYKEHLRRSEGRLKLLFERSADVLYVTTPEGQILDMNPAGVKLLGYNSLQEVLKLNVKDLYWESDTRRNFKEIINEKGFVKDFELLLKNREGKKLTVLITANAVTNEQGKIVAYEGIMRDITEKKQLEQQLFQAQKMESIGLLTGSIAHDFNNILTAVNGYAEMIRRGLPEEHPQQIYVSHILRAGRRAENLIRQLLAFSRKQIIEPRIVNINQIISDLRKMLRQLISEDIELHTELTDNIDPIKADPGQIEQVLVNLIINSRDALNQVKDINLKKFIKVQTQQVTLDEDFVARHPGSRVGEFIRISISDNGIGIPDHIQTKIFEPFFTTKEEGKGTGLGLSTVYGIIKQNEGSIYLESEPGQGATFHIYWPVSEEKEDESKKDDTSEVTTKAEEIIMVVEDDLDVRELACTFLTNLGYKVYEAENGARALEIINEQNLVDKIDLIFSDMVMPIMGGDQLAEEIKKINPNIKVLLTSGYTDSQLMKTGLWNRGYHFLHKPYTIQQMAKKVRKVLDNQ